MLIWDSKADSSKPTHAETIVLRRGANGWYADWALTSRAGEYRRLTGSAIIPLPFTLFSPAVDVFNAIKARNPEYVIHVA